MDYNVKSFEKKDVPMSYELLFQRAVQLHEAGQLNEAEQIYRRILETAPQQPEVLNLLGLVAQAKGVQDEACSLFYQAIRQAPARAPFYYNLAFSLKLDNKPVEALESFEKRWHCNRTLKKRTMRWGLSVSRWENLSRPAFIGARRWRLTGIMSKPRQTGQ